MGTFVRYTLFLQGLKKKGGYNQGISGGVGWRCVVLHEPTKLPNEAYPTSLTIKSRSSKNFLFQGSNLNH